MKERITVPTWIMVMIMKGKNNTSFSLPLSHSLFLPSCSKTAQSIREQLLDSIPSLNMLESLNKTLAIGNLL